MRTRILVFAIGLATLAAGCGAAGETPAAPRTASLAIEQVLDTSGPMFVEGYLWSLEIADADGHRIFDGDLDGTAHAEELPEGRYTIRSAMKPCDGNCAYTDEPVNACELELEVVAPTTAVVVDQAADRACRITVL